MENTNIYPEYYTVYRDEKGRMVKAEKRKPYKKITIGVWAIRGIIIVFVIIGLKYAGVFAAILASSDNDEENGEITEEGATNQDKIMIETYEETETSDEEQYLKDGEVFPESSSVFLSVHDIESIHKTDKYSRLEIIQLAINEIYAREGYHFKEPGWKEYYSRYTWYKDQGYTDAETRELFNEYERENIRLLVAERETIRGY